MYCSLSLYESSLLACSCQWQEACGLSSKANELVEDIDKLDGDNELAVVDYIQDIYSYYKTAQVTTIPLPLQYDCSCELF